MCLNISVRKKKIVMGDTEDLEVIENLTLEETRLSFDEEDEREDLEMDTFTEILYEVSDGLSIANFKPLESLVVTLCKSDNKKKYILFVVVVQCLSCLDKKKYEEADEYEFYRIVKNINFKFDAGEINGLFCGTLEEIQKNKFSVDKIKLHEGKFKTMLKSVLKPGSYNTRKFITNAERAFEDRF